MKKNITVILFVAFVLVFLGHAIKKEYFVNDTDSIKIGVSVSLTGPAAFIGESYVAGLRLAEEEINNAGGINGRKIELLIEDNKNSGSEAVTVFRKLMLKKPDLFLSTMSTPTVPFSSLAKETKIPLFMSAVFADVTPTNNNSVSFFPKPTDDAMATVEDMKINKIKRVAVIFLNSEYGQASLSAFEGEASANGITITGKEAFTGELTDFSAPLLKAISTKPQAIYIIAVNSLPIIEQLKSQEKSILIYTNMIPVAGSLVYKKPDTFENVHLTASRVAINDTGEYQNFREKIESKINIADNSLGYTAIAYDNLNIIATVLSRDDDTEKFVETFKGLGVVKGVNGEFNLNSRNVGMKMYPVVFKEGKIIEVK